MSGVANIPAIAEMIGQGERWVLWYTVKRKGKATKIPLQASGDYADSTDPNTWCSFERALSAMHELRARGKRVDGVGYVLAAERDGICGMDLDGCRDKASGEIKPWALDLVRETNSYTELSPSGTGLKVYLRASPVPKLSANKLVIAKAENGGKDEAIEVYTTGRYFAVTGKHLEGTPDEIADATEAFERLAARIARDGEGGRSKSNRKAAAPPPADLPPIDESLPAFLRAILENDPKLRHAWTTGAKLGKGGDLSASGLESSLTVYLARYLRDEELAEALHHYPHGQLGGGKLRKGEAERRLKRLLEMAAEARANPAGFDLTHDGLALEWGQAWQQDARHVPIWARWMFFTGSRWERDDRLAHMTYMRDFLRAKAEELAKWAEEKAKEAEASGDKKEQAEAEKAKEWAKGTGKALRSAPMVANVMGLARSNAELVATDKEWDRDPWLLGTPGGTVELRTGRLREARRNDFITCSAAVAPAAPGTPTPLWTAFLERIFGGDQEMITFVQKVAGYALTGSVEEHALFFLWGQGANGKGVFVNTLTRLLDSYASVAPVDMFLVTQSDRHPTDMAMLRAARLVTAQETPPGRTWDEAKIKALTGGDPITARFMRQDFFTYEPQFTLVIAGNTKPSLRGVSEAIRRRFFLIPFNVIIPPAERDKGLAEKLRTEWPAILRWAIEGCLAWQREGLKPPAGVVAATDDYLAGEDIIGQWISDCCEEGYGHSAVRDDLYTSWCEWSERNRGPRHSSRAFYRILDERGFEQRKSDGKRLFDGLVLRQSVLAGQEGQKPDISTVIDFNDDAPARARAHTRDTSYMGASCPSCPPAGATSPPWTDDRAWIAQVSAAPGSSAKLETLLAWGKAAGGHVATANESISLVLPPNLPRGMALSELHRFARELHIEVSTGGRA